MYPYYRWSCKPPSRLLWFCLGAGSALWWLKSKEAHSYHLKAKFCSRHRIPPEAYPLPGPPSHHVLSWISGSSYDDVREKPDRSGCDWYGQRSSWGSCPKTSCPNGKPCAPPTWDGWEDERLRMMELSNKANEKFTEFSEAALESILSTVTALKAKLVEHRAQHERQSKQLQAMRKEQMRMYAEWANSQQPPPQQLPPFPPSQRTEPQ